MLPFNEYEEQQSDISLEFEDDADLFDTGLSDEELLAGINQGITSVSPRVLSYSEVIDNRISVPAQHSLVRLSKNPATSADAVAMLKEIKAGRLSGIYCVNWQKPAQCAMPVKETPHPWAAKQCPCC